jgi:hypothetical protein
MPDDGDLVTGWRCGFSLPLGEGRAGGEVQWSVVEWSGVAAGLCRDAGPHLFGFWRPGETGPSPDGWRAGVRSAACPERQMSD